MKFDDRDNVTPGWKFNEWELKGVPVRVEIGPRDLAEGKVMSVRRDTFEKAPLDIEGLEGEIKAMLDAIQTNMFEIARAFRDAHTADVHNMEELGRQVDGGYAKAMWCGDQACEDEIKDRFSASSRCMPFDQTPIGETCVCCGVYQEGHLFRKGILMLKGAVQTYSPFFPIPRFRKERRRESQGKTVRADAAGGAALRAGIRDGRDEKPSEFELLNGQYMQLAGGKTRYAVADGDAYGALPGKMAGLHLPAGKYRLRWMISGDGDNVLRLKTTTARPLRRMNSCCLPTRAKANAYLKSRKPAKTLRSKSSLPPAVIWMCTV